MKLFQTVIISALWCISSLFSQVNTEAMRDSKQLPGLHHQLNLSYAYISGNSEIMVLHGKYRMDYHPKSNWHGFFVTRYDRAFEKNKDDFTNKGFGHLRAVNHFRSNVHIEFFLQKEETNTILAS